MEFFCPSCESESVDHIFLQYEGTCITSDYVMVEHAKIDNCICKACGLIFNAYGPRLNPGQFYKTSYQLMAQSPNSKVQSFSEGKGRSQALVTYEIFREMIATDTMGAILEVGAGKGEFLSYFAKDHACWMIEAFEPSQSFECLKKTLGNRYVEKCSYEEFTLGPAAPYDVIIALGVLEHVNDPLDMIRWANRNLLVGGHFFVRVPNFAFNPNDLFCADHLSKLTVSTIVSFADASGFQVTSVKEKGVPVFVCLEKISENFCRPSNAYVHNVCITQKNAENAKLNIEAVLEARRSAFAEDGSFGIFGLGASGLFAPFYGNFPASDIALFIDENETMWGNTVLGRPIKGLDGVTEHSLSFVVLAVSPVYRDEITAKLTPLGIGVV